MCPSKLREGGSEQSFTAVVLRLSSMWPAGSRDEYKEKQSALGPSLLSRLIFYTHTQYRRTQNARLHDIPSKSFNEKLARCWITTHVTHARPSRHEMPFFSWRKVLPTHIPWRFFPTFPVTQKSLTVRPLSISVATEPWHLTFYTRIWGLHFLPC